MTKPKPRTERCDACLELAISLKTCTKEQCEQRDAGFLNFCPSCLKGHKQNDH